MEDASGVRVVEPAGHVAGGAEPVASVKGHRGNLAPDDRVDRPAPQVRHQPGLPARHQLDHPVRPDHVRVLEPPKDHELGGEQFIARPSSQRPGLQRHAQRGRGTGTDSTVSGGLVGDGGSARRSGGLSGGGGATVAG